MKNALLSWTLDNKTLSPPVPRFIRRRIKTYKTAYKSSMKAYKASRLGFTCKVKFCLKPQDPAPIILMQVSVRLVEVAGNSDSPNGWDPRTQDLH